MIDEIIWRSVISIVRMTEINTRSTKDFGNAIDSGIVRADRKMENVQSAWI